MPKTLRARYLLGFALATIILVAVGASIMLATQRFRADTRWVSHSHNVIGHLAQIRVDLLEGISTQRSYLLTGDPSYRDEYQAVRPALRIRAATLAAMVVDNPGQTQRVNELGELIEQRLDSANEAMRIYDAQGLAATQRYLSSNRGHDLMLRIQQQMERMESSEQALLAQRNRTSARSANLLLGLGALGIPLSLLIVWSIYVLLSREVRERETAQRKADTLNRDLNRSVADLQRASSDLEELGHYAGLLQGCHNIPEALDVTRIAIARLLPQAFGSIYLLRASQDYAELETSWGEPLVSTHPLLLPQECWALRRAKPHYVDDLRGGTACSHIESVTDVAVASACLPLSAQNMSLGFLCLMAPGPGGEEFTLILPEAGLEVAIQRAEDIRRAAQAMTVPHLQRSIGGVTVSIGVAMFPSHAVEVGDLKRVADAALYRAKRRGRNRVEVAEPD